MGNEDYREYSIKEYKGFEYGQKIKINNRSYSIYRINDKTNQITLIGKRSGFGYIDIDDLIKLMAKGEKL